jgi:hypothetical protein
MVRIRQHLSYANVVATLALMFAMSGGAIAATGGFTAASSGIKACVGANGVLKLLSGKKCKGGQKAVSWNQQGPAGAKGPAGAQGATGPIATAGLNGDPGPSATTALTADNALALGGIPASGFTRSDCASTTGQIKGFALVPANPPEGFTRVNPSYNCSGQAVEVLEPESGAGIYIVRFLGNPAEIAMATAVDDEPLQGPGVASVKQLAPGEFEVFTASPSEQLAQQAFELLLP